MLVISSSSSTAKIIPFPSRSLPGQHDLLWVRRPRFVVRVEREGPAWLVVCRDHGWLGDRDAAIADAITIARGRRRREPLTNSAEFAQANTAAPEGAYTAAIPAPQLA